MVNEKRPAGADVSRCIFRRRKKTGETTLRASGRGTTGRRWLKTGVESRDPTLRERESRLCVIEFRRRYTYIAATRIRALDISGV